MDVITKVWGILALYMQRSRNCEVSEYVYDSCLASFLLEYQYDKNIVCAEPPEMIYPVIPSA